MLVLVQAAAVVASPSSAAADAREEKIDKREAEVKQREAVATKKTEEVSAACCPRHVFAGCRPGPRCTGA